MHSRTKLLSVLVSFFVYFRWFVQSFDSIRVFFASTIVLMLCSHSLLDRTLPHLRVRNANKVCGSKGIKKKIFIRKRSTGKNTSDMQQEREGSLRLNIKKRTFESRIYSMQSHDDCLHLLKLMEHFFACCFFFF